MSIPVNAFSQDKTAENYLTLFDIKELESLMERLNLQSKGRSSEASDRTMQNLAEILSESGDIRSLQGVPPTLDWSNLRDLLLQQFPHFEEVIEILQGSWHLASRAGTHLKMPPILLLGEAGLGKTTFASYLAKQISLEYHEICMATTTANFVLSGMSPNWSEARPGEIFRKLVYGKQANPIFLLDEIDKCSGREQRDPLSPLFSLLEGHTAKKFCDEFFPLPIDASQIQWIATANSLESIPEPIQSRMRIITVRVPTWAERVNITKNIYRDIISKESWGRIFSPDLDDALCENIAENCQTPREIGQALRQVCGEAASRPQTNHKLSPALIDLRPKSHTAPLTSFGFIPKQTGDAPIRKAL